MEPSTSYSPSAASSSSSCDETKLFVGGISRETTVYWLVEYFSKYGEVAWANVIENKITGGSKGFAFVRFVDSAAAERVLADTREHIILGRKVEVKKAIPKYHGYQNQQHLPAIQYQDRNGELTNSIINSHHGIPFNPRKIFVGGLSPNLTEDEFSSFFEQFGEIKDAVMMYDNFGRLRGFGFIEFRLVEVAEKVLQNRFYKLKDKNVEVKRAVPKNANNYDNEINSSFSEHMITDCRGGYVLDNSQAGFYQVYGPRYGGLQDYMFQYFLGHTSQHSLFVGGYHAGCYDGFDYRSPYPYLRSPLNLMPYGSTSLYPGYLNSGFSGYLKHDEAIWCSDNSNDGNWDQNLSDMRPQNVDGTTSQSDNDATRPQGNSAEQLYSYCKGNREQNLSDMQSQNVEDIKPYLDAPKSDNDDTAPQHDEDSQLAAQQYSNCNGDGKQNFSDMQLQNVEDTTPHRDDKTVEPDNDDAIPQHDEDGQAAKMAKQLYNNTLIDNDDATPQYDDAGNLAEYSNGN